MKPAHITKGDLLYVKSTVQISTPAAGCYLCRNKVGEQLGTAALAKLTQEVQALSVLERKRHVSSGKKTGRVEGASGEFFTTETHFGKAACSHVHNGCLG